MWGVMSWVICVLVGLIPAYLVYKKDKLSGHKLFFIPAILRGIIFFLVAMLLLAPPFSWLKTDTKKPTIILLQDNSTSIKDALGNDTNLLLNNLKKIENDLGDDYEVKLVKFGSEITTEDTPNFIATATNIDWALSNAIQRYRNNNLSAVILASDGIYNEGNDPRYFLNAQQIPIYSVAIGDSTHAKDIAVLRTFSNKIILLGNSMEVATDVKFIDFPNTTHSIQLLQNGQTIQQKSVTISDEEQIISASFELKPTKAGMYRYTIAVPQVNGEKSVLNNHLDFFVEVIANETKVLLLNNGSHPDIGIIKEALKSVKGYTITVAPPNSLPENWQDYKIIIALQPNLPTNLWLQLKNAQKPIWYILGNYTNPILLAALKPIVEVSPGATASFFQPQVNSAYASFKLPLTTANVMAQLPPLEANIAKVSYKDKANIILNDKTGKGAIWIAQGGNNPYAITIGEGLWRWNMYEYKNTKKHEVVNALIQQTMSVMNVPKVDQPFVVSLSKRLVNENENLSFNAELRNKTGQLVNDAKATLTIRDKDGNKKSFDFDKMDDRYSLVIPQLAGGNYNYFGTATYQGKTYTDQGTFAVESTPLEKINTQADFELMYQLSQQSKGQFYTLQNMLQVVNDIIKNPQIKPTLLTAQQTTPFIDFKWIFVLILLLLTVEWLLRKYWGMM